MWKPLIRKITHRTQRANTQSDTRAVAPNPLITNTRSRHTVSRQAATTNVGHFPEQPFNQHSEAPPDHTLEHLSDYLPDDVPDHLIAHMFDDAPEHRAERVAEHLSDHLSDHLPDDVPDHLIAHMFDDPLERRSERVAEHRSYHLSDHLSDDVPDHLIEQLFNDVPDNAPATSSAAPAISQSPEDFVLQAQQILMDRIEHHLTLIDQRLADRLSPDVASARAEDRRHYEYSSGGVLAKYGEDNGKLFQRDKKNRDNIERRNDVDKRDKLNVLNKELMVTLEQAFISANAALDRLDPPPDYDNVFPAVLHSHTTTHRYE